MKKFLLGCVAFSVLLGGITYISFTQIPLSSPKISTNTIPSSIKTYTLEEEQILAAAETYLYYQNLDETIRVDVKADGNDFIITFENPRDSKEPRHELRLVRIADFNGKKQYKITSNSWINWAEIARVNFPNPQITIDEYTQTTSWVPDLSLTTNTSLKTKDIVVKDSDISLQIGSIISDSMIAPQNNKMDIASASTMTDLKITTPMFELSIPKIVHDAQIIGADQTGIDTMQALSSEKSISSLMIPVFSIVSPLLGKEAITGTLENTLTLDNSINVSMRISDIKVPNIPIMPLSVNASVSLNGLDKSDIISYMELSEKYDTLANNKTPEAADLEKQLFNLYNNIAPKLSITIEDINLVFKDGSININGIIKPDGNNISTEANIQVVNFDTLSPKPQPADKDACAKALEKITPNTTKLPAECAVQQTGMLDFLRPFLDTNKRTTNDNGQSVDTFNIQYRQGGVSINGQEILPPSEVQPTDDVKLSINPA